jgi:glycosyltransferase involved in cell wall biosynthesis
VPNGVDDAPLTPIYAERLRRQPAGPPRFAFVGRLCRPKGVEDLLEAFARAELPAGTELIFAGDGPLRAALAARAAALGIGDRVRLDGYTADVTPLLRRIDALVLPSYSEGLPRVLMEAGAAGVPIVASDIAGVREIVRDGESALLVPPHDVPALAGALQRIAADPALGPRLAGAAHATVQRGFTAAQQARRLAHEYWALARNVAAEETA